MSLTFSQRMGLEPIKELQTHSMDNDLRTRLWNAFHDTIWKKMSTTQYSRNIYITGWGKEFLTEAGQHYFKEPVDTIQTERTRSQGKIRHYFLDTATWHGVYSFIEFICQCSTLSRQPVHKKNFAQQCNTILEKEMSGYRIVDQLVTPITNSIEIASIEEAINSPYEFANQHLHSALEKLSDRDNPDYRNSIKESITAVDSICTKLMDTSTLGKALDKIESKLGFNKQLKQGLEKLYSYTNGGSGIRHPLTEEGHHPTLDEAKFMLVACSAFVNYLTAKASVLND